MSNGIVDIFIVYSLLRKLVTPFEKTPAFQLGLIDAEGKRLKRAETKEEKKAMTYLDRLVFNMKRLLSQVPGGRTVLGSYVAALLLLREQTDKVDDMEYLREQYVQEMTRVDMKTFKQFTDLLDKIEEEAPTNSTGPAVAGTDGNIHWSKRQPKIGIKGQMRKYGQPITWSSVIRRAKNKDQKGQ